MEDAQYFGLDMLSNSRLGIIECLVNGRSFFKANPETLEFGRQLHQACLEIEKYEALLHTEPYQKNKHKVYEMAKALRKNTLFSMLVHNVKAKKEYLQKWNEERYGLECKAKIDLGVLKTIGDVKSTAATTYSEFLASITQYGYDRQAAFYLDGTGATKFIFFGIGKKYPHQTFTVIYNWNDPVIIEGRKKYEDLIDSYLELRQKGEIDFEQLMHF
jgi:hypothetical protein